MSSGTLKDYWYLIRGHKPIGTLLLLWPTLCGLWLAAEGIPSLTNLFIFTFGVFIMRSAGCVINDFADRHIDRHVARTKERPLTTGVITSKQALTFFVTLLLIAFILVLFTNPFTIALSFIALALASSYPFMKRYTHFPQVVLGAAFAWGIPMAFTAETNQLPWSFLPLFFAAVCWIVVFDTFYAMVDREDDLKIGVKSTAVLFGQYDLILIACFQLLCIIGLIITGSLFMLGVFWWLALFIVTGLFAYQLYLAKDRINQRCFRAFLNNNYVGLVLFIGLALNFSSLSSTS